VNIYLFSRIFSFHPESFLPLIFLVFSVMPSECSTRVNAILNHKSDLFIIPPLISSGVRRTMFFDPILNSQRVEKIVYENKSKLIPPLPVTNIPKPHNPTNSHLVRREGAVVKSVLTDQAEQRRIRIKQSHRNCGPTEKENVKKSTPVSSNRQPTRGPIVQPPTIRMAPPDAPSLMIPRSPSEPLPASESVRPLLPSSTLTAPPESARALSALAKLIEESNQLLGREHVDPSPDDEQLLDALERDLRQFVNDSSENPHLSSLEELEKDIIELINK
jgi:hypothetical protein